jgi:uncharacterized protein DUF3306
MSEPEKSLQNFFERWSRRKLAAAEPAGAAPDTRANELQSAPPDPAVDAPADPAAPAFDAASLPPIESIKAASDVRAFLVPGVPIELTRAALRRAWLSDPAIRNFVGLAENQWDFTQADGVPGFGALELTSNLRRMLAALHGDAPAQDAIAAGDDFGKTVSPEPVAELSTDAAAESPTAECQTSRQASDNHVAMRDDLGGGGLDQVPGRRKHGRAVPK